MRKGNALLILSLLLVVYSCEEILLEHDISGEGVDLLAPVGNVVLSTSDVTFHWTEVDGATNYHLQIVTPNFETPQQIISDTLVEGNYYFQNLGEKEYEWRVSAINSGYNTPYASSRFTVEGMGDFSAKNINLFSPSENFLSNSRRITFNWGEIEEATLYRFQILKEGEVLLEKTTEQTDLQFDVPEGAYTWRVRAENDTNNTLYSERTITVDATKPNTPQLINPVDEEVLPTTSVTFEWSREQISGSSEIDSLFIFGDVGLNELIEKEQVTTSYTTFLERETTYYWLLKSYDAAGNIGEQSEIFSFSIE